ALTHEVAYGSMLQERRKALHNRIVEGIEQLYQGRLVEQVELLAHHALRAEVWDKALTFSREAAEKALDRSANREAWSYLEQAISAVSRLPHTTTALEQAVDLRLAARMCLSPLNEFARVLTLGLEAELLAKALNDNRREALVDCSISIALSTLGRGREAI